MRKPVPVRVPYRCTSTEYRLYSTSTKPYCSRSATQYSVLVRYTGTSTVAYGTGTTCSGTCKGYMFSPYSVLVPVLVPVLVLSTVRPKLTCSGTYVPVLSTCTVKTVPVQVHYGTGSVAYCTSNCTRVLKVLSTASMLSYRTSTVVFTCRLL